MLFALGCYCVCRLATPPFPTTSAHLSLAIEIREKKRAARRATNERERYHDDVCVIQSDRLTIRHGILSALGGVKKMGARTSYSFVIGWGFVALIKAKLASSMTKPFIWRTIGEVVFKIALVEEFMLSSHFIRPLA
jgi:hypothetical protein